MNAAKRAMNYIAGKLGYTVVPNWRLERYEQAQYLSRLFQLFNIDCVLDVGANLGQYRDFLRHEVNYSGTIVSYEPIPAHADAMKRRAADDADWMIEAKALGSECAMTTMNVMSSTPFSSFLTPDHSTVSRFGDLNVVQQQVNVEMLTLDQSMRELAGKLGGRRTYLKLDTQGFDLEVAKGATATLQQVVALQSEVSFKAIYAGMPDYSTSIRTFERSGFEVSAMFRNNPDHFPELIELDCHMIASRMLSPAKR